MRDFQKGLEAVGIQNLLPSTSTASVRFAKSHALEHSEVRLSDGTIAQWLGPRTGAKAIVVLFHGGGYMSPALPEHIALAFDFAEVPRRDVASFILQHGTWSALNS